MLQEVILKKRKEGMSREVRGQAIIIKYLIHGGEIGTLFTHCLLLKECFV